jgi:hypothetical protein
VANISANLKYLHTLKLQILSLKTNYLELRALDLFMYCKRITTQRVVRSSGILGFKMND